VTLPGGDLAMEWRESDDHILMTGPIAYEFEGTLPAHLAV
jgi:diaminopimelate epimerase